MSILALPEWESTQATLLLIPSQHIPPPPPASVSVIDSQSQVYEESWDTELLTAAHGALLRAIGVDSKSNWKDVNGMLQRKSNRLLRRTGDVGEGSMYI